MKKQNNLEKMRHSASHLMAAAVQKMFPKVKFAIGPAIEDGFYYDFELPRPLTPEDLKKIEKMMKKMKHQNTEFKKDSWGMVKAKNYFKKNDQKYKLELIEKIKSENPKEKNVYIYSLGDFTDLCSGPHVKSTKEIGEFKLTRISGAYWQGNEKNKMLQRIYGVAFKTKEELNKYIERIEEAKRRDHRVLGKQLGLFIFDDEVGPALPLWMPKGATLLNEVKNYAFNMYLENGYMPVSTPHIASASLWKHSGHLDFYSENMYGDMAVDKDKYRLKPMNCPFHVKIYNSELHSYKDLPIRYTEMGTVYRYERSGVTHGIARTRGFTQDDAHIICTPDQLDKEVLSALKLTKKILKAFGFKDFEVNLSTRDPKNLDKFAGDDASWEMAENALKNAIKKAGFDDFVEDVGGAVFYGPKIDIKVSDALGRPWQLSTIQFDFNLPGRFNMTYVDKDGNEQTPFMIHRALLGSLERFISVLIEHYAGAFPTWLAPTQVKILPIADRHQSFAKKLLKQLSESKIRVELDDRSESIGKKIREAQMQKVPYMIIIGDEEIKKNKLSIRNRKGKEDHDVKTEKFIEDITKEIKDKK